MRRLLIIFISLLLIIAGVFGVVRYYDRLKMAEELYAQAQSRFTEYGESDNRSVIVIDDNADKLGEIIESTLKSEEEALKRNDEEKAEDKGYSNYTFRYNGPWENQLDVDLAPLMTQYPDIKGWLFFENEDISYPILQSATDDKYMRMTYTGESTSAGSIFMESLNASDFSDTHTIIYGHNMKNRTMFGSLRNYVNQPQYYDYHKYFQIITLNTEGKIVKSRYKVFAYGKVKSFARMYTVCRENDEAFLELLQYIQSELTSVPEVPVYPTDRIVTLSTCSLGETRLAVCGVKVEEVIE